jgi:hypothetical protein
MLLLRVSTCTRGKGGGKILVEWVPLLNVITITRSEDGTNNTIHHTLRVFSESLSTIVRLISEESNL